MTDVRIWISRLLDVVFRRRRDDRLDEEIESHLRLLETELVAKGATPEEARVAARREFGRVDLIKNEYRDQRGVPASDAISQDARFAVRLLWRDPSFTLAGSGRPRPRHRREQHAFHDRQRPRHSRTAYP